MAPESICFGEDLRRSRRVQQLHPIEHDDYHHAWLLVTTRHHAIVSHFVV